MNVLEIYAGWIVVLPFVFVMLRNLEAGIARYMTKLYYS